MNGKSRTYRDHAELREAAAADYLRDERADRWRRTAGLLPPLAAAPGLSVPHGRQQV